jgi:predicted  nucleic acid-binding Zn-ribbon protein
LHPDLDRLIRLQQLETTADEARRKIADHPQRAQALEERLAAARDAVAGVKTRLTDAQNKRRAEEKDVSTIQTRLAKYKDQLLEVKTNREYQAMLHEIETAQNEIKTREDSILVTMMESDDLAAEVKKTEAELKAVEKEVGAGRQVLEQEVSALEAELEKTARARAALTSEIDRGVLAIFEQVAKGRKGIAVSEAKDGMCTICHVRLRPQVFNEVRRNASIIQCDSCRRILYFVEQTPAPSAVPQP